MRVTMKQGIFVLCLLFFSVNSIYAQTLEEQAQKKIEELNTLIGDAQANGIDVLKEQMTVRTAEVFLEFANWDEQNLDSNETLFGLTSAYKDTARESALMLPDFERNDVIKMLDEAKITIEKLIAEEIFREPTPNVDWATASHVGDHIEYNGKPVFISDYTWKPEIDKLTEFYGDLGGTYIDLNKVKNAEGDINPWLLKEIEDEGEGTLGWIFLGNKSVPKWSKEKYGPNFSMRTNTFTGYDIDNPGARDLLSMLFAGVVPSVAGKKMSELGYLLCNEPHFYTTKKGDKLDWASGPVSDYTIEKFKTWLATKHNSIADLNTLWGTSFSSFNEVEIEIPIDVALTGTPKWYDWTRFNNYRVTEWYRFLKAEIRKHDPSAKVHLKIMPNLWTGNKRGHGIDMEALTEMSEIIGNDSGADHTPMWGGPYEWQEHYCYDWRELYMGFDFYRSVGPDKLMVNSETHYFSTTKSRDLFLDPAFVRSSFWSAHTLGLDVNQIWFWCRQEDGSPKTLTEKGYAGSNNQQPRVTNEIHSTLMDLNAFSDDIMSMQRQKKSIRIFYSETSAINKTSQMDELFELYEALNFEGLPLGFATENIIKTQPNTLWDVILIHKTEYITPEELAALQSYLDAGGTIVTDKVSLKEDQYKRALTALDASNGTIVIADTVEEMKTAALKVVEAKGDMPGVEITENSTIGKKACSWKNIVNSEGEEVVSIVNLGNQPVELTIKLKDTEMKTRCIDIINNIDCSSTPVLQPNDVYFVKVIEGDTPTNSNKKKKSEAFSSVYPNPTTGRFTTAFTDCQENVELKLYNSLQQLVWYQSYKGVKSIDADISALNPAIYFLKISNNNSVQSVSMIKE